MAGLTNGSELTDPPGSAGVISETDTVLTWDLLEDFWRNYVAGGYFWFKYVFGDSDTMNFAWYTSQQKSGDNDWAAVAPINDLTTVPVIYSVEMPAESMVWITAIPLPEGVRRVKCIMTTTGGTPTDVVTVRLIKAAR
jgi:hypothetical protein